LSPSTAAPMTTEGTSRRAWSRPCVTRVRSSAASVPSVVIGAAVDGDKVSLVVATNDAGRSAGQSANRVLQAALAQIGGRGGGKDDMAQGGGTGAGSVDAAFTAASTAVREADAG